MPSEASTGAPALPDTPTPGVDVQAPARPAIEVWTIQLGKWRLAKQREIALLNITAGSGVQAFAPDFELVKRFKRHEMSEDDYTDEYVRRMAQSRKLFPKIWEQLNDKDQVALACYCRAGDYCHRRLFVPLMKSYLQEEHDRELTYKGELKE